MPENPEAIAPVVAIPAGGDGMPPPVRPRRPVARALALVGLVIALGVGIYAFVQELDKSSTAEGDGHVLQFGWSVMQLAYDHRGRFRHFPQSRR